MRNQVTNIVIALTIFFGSVGCYTERKAERQVDKAHHQYPGVPAKFCADVYPPRDSIGVIKEYIQGEDVIVTDTVVQTEFKNDTLVITHYITRFVNNTDTFRDTKYIQLENKAAIVVKDGQIGLLKIEGSKISTSRNTWRTWALVGWGIVALLAVWKILKIYFGRKII